MRIELGAVAAVFGQLAGGQGQAAHVGQGVGAALGGGAVVVFAGRGAQRVDGGVDDGGGLMAEPAGQPHPAGAVRAQGEGPVAGGAFVGGFEVFAPLLLGQLGGDVVEDPVGGHLQRGWFQHDAFGVEQHLLGFGLHGGAVFGQAGHRFGDHPGLLLVDRARVKRGGGRRARAVQRGGQRQHLAGRVEGDPKLVAQPHRRRGGTLTAGQIAAVDLTDHLEAAGGDGLLGGPQPEQARRTIRCPTATRPRDHIS